MHPEVYKSLREIPFTELNKINATTLIEFLTGEKKWLEGNEAELANSPMYSINPHWKVLRVFEMLENKDDNAIVDVQEFLLKHNLANAYEFVVSKLSYYNSPYTHLVYAKRNEI